MRPEQIKRKRGNSALYTGLFIVALGVIWLLRKAGVYLPGWIFSWQTILIVIGLGIGVGNNFRNAASWVLIGIGTIFLINDIFFIPFEIRQYFWPVLVIAIGLVIIFKPRSRWRKHVGDGDSVDSHVEVGSGTGTFGRDDVLDIVSIFNGLKRSITSKNFKGGESVTVFGGSEINLLQADFEKEAVLDVTVVFGGLKLIVPKNWEVRTEVTSILAGVEDKRYSAVEVLPDEKVFIITGTVVFGGIDIASY
jgi:predicted membrane protein